MEKTETEKLAARFRGKVAAGLSDVKFYLSNEVEATTEQICGEINRLYEAVDSKDFSPLKFSDSYLK